MTDSLIPVGWNLLYAAVYPEMTKNNAVQIVRFEDVIYPRTLIR
jgi:hypothetical protein